MKRTASAFVLLTALSGCVSMDRGEGPDAQAHAASSTSGCYNGGGTPPMVPGVQGPWGQPIQMTAPYAANPPGAQAALAMMNKSVPLTKVQMDPRYYAAQSGGVTQASYNPSCGPNGCSPGSMGPSSSMIAPPGLPFGPGAMTPGAGMGPFGPGAGAGMGPFGPGMGGPGMGLGGPGAMLGGPGAGLPGAVAAVGALTSTNPNKYTTQRTEIRFAKPNGMKISWYAGTGDGKAGFSSTQIEAPGRYNFAQGAIYRLKLSNIDGRPQVNLYPTLEVVPSNAKTDPFLAHAAVPVEFTNDDFDQVAAGNYVVKVIYLPDPQFQDVAVAGGLEEINSSRLEPGTDPIQEALRRGSILLVIRMGNIDLELQNTPAMDAPSPFAQPACPPSAGPGLGLGMPGPGLMTPYGAGPGAMMPFGQGGPGGPMMGAGPGGPFGPAMQGAPGQMMGPSGQPNMPAGPTPQAVNTPAAPMSRKAPSGRNTPLVQLPETSAVKQVGYVPSGESLPTPAELAAQK